MSEKILKIIEEGGDELQREVSNLLKENGWKTQLSPYYNDMVTGKPREIDIIARKEFVVMDNFWGKSEKILIRLFIECKHIKNETLFYLAPRNGDEAIKFVQDNHLLRHEENIDLSKNHYLSDDEVIKTWKTTPGGRDDIYDGWNQAVHSMIYYSQNSNEGYYTVDYPIVVTRDFSNFYKRGNGEKDFSAIGDNIQLEIDYTYPSKSNTNVSKTFFIDLVSLDKLFNLLCLIEQNDLPILRRKMDSILFTNSQQDSGNRSGGYDPFNPVSFDPYY